MFLCFQEKFQENNNKFSSNELERLGSNFIYLRFLEKNPKPIYNFFQSKIEFTFVNIACRFLYG